MRRGQLTNVLTKQVWIDADCFLVYPTGLKLFLYNILRYFLPKVAAKFVELDPDTSNWIDRTTKKHTYIYSKALDYDVAVIKFKRIGYTVQELNSDTRSIRLLANRASVHAIVSNKPLSCTKLVNWVGITTKAKL